jgi:hypothetical protein
MATDANAGTGPSGKLDLQAASTATLVLASILYLLGALTANIYIHSLGVSEMVPARPAAIQTGIWSACLLIALAAFPVFVSLEISRRWKASNRLHVTIAALILGLLSCLAVAAVFDLIQSRIFHYFSWDVGLMDYWQCTKLTAGGFITCRALYRSLILFLNSRLLSWVGLSCMVVGIISWMVFLSIFADYIYPLIPASVGGGRSNEVRLLVKPESIDGLRNLQVEFTNNSDLTDALTPLIENESSIVVTKRFPHTQVSYSVVIPKDEIVAVVPAPQNATDQDMKTWESATIWNGDPQIQYVSPRSARVGDEITITGQNLGTSGRVTVGGKITAPTKWSDTEIVAPVPAGATSGSVVVKANGMDSKPGQFNLTP